MTLVIGIGNPDRGDDAAGLAVARNVRAAAPAGVAVIELDGDQLALLDAWDGAAYELGAPLSPEAETAARTVARQILRDLRDGR
jgi:Ni,Fe-hydrogenase maturation factor